MSIEASVVDDATLREYLERYAAESGASPRLTDRLDLAASESGAVDVLYPLGEGQYVHIHPQDGTQRYTVVEPMLTDEEVGLLHRIKDRVFEEALYLEPPKDRGELEREITKLFGEVVSTRRRPGAIVVDAARVDRLRYHLLRDVARAGPLEPLMRDPYLEDIHLVGTAPVHIIHKRYGMLATNVRFPDPHALDTYVRNLAERVGRPVSDAQPIVDATLSDGSRINIVYSDDISRRGPSMSIRRVHEDPVSITQLIAWKTLSAELAAYLWLCLENGMSVFVCGEAACGKSTTLNALLSFVNPRSKIYTAEDTPEVRPPHPVWQRLLTRESGPQDARVRMFDLLKAALRSRPNYIVVGEIRGAEGAVAFQAMQTGHPTVASFHAANVVKMIQRLTSEPINIPLTFIDNLNVAVFQQAIERDRRLIRRVTAVDEIEGYSEADGGVLTRPVFAYDPMRDSHVFRGNNNSYILERKIAEHHGYENPREIYPELQRRARALARMTALGIVKHDEVNRLLFVYADGGLTALERELGVP